ncbi:MAG TPA: hypothetical protein PLS53_00315 [Thermoanaerobaculaceae bacterium]|nr:hypothetical protein [Thermoanaerobaculaceae bacterium]HPS76577.1 hypothetical protein [Thermoanaerobaculaceae bacterium]
MIPTSMGANKLEIRKGDRNSVIDYTGILAAGASIPAGFVCSLNGSGLLIPGVTSGGTEFLPFFAWSGTDVNNAPDVTRVGALDGGGPPQVRDSVAALGVGGIAMPYAGAARFGTISCFAAVELATTGFNSAVAYKPGQLLTCVRAGVANAGKIMPVAATTDLVVGVVAPAGLYTSPDGYATLAFYPTRMTPTDSATTTVPAAL